MSLAFLTLSLHRQLPDCCIYNAIIIFNFVGCFLLQLHTITTVTRLCWFFYTNITYFTFKIFCFWCINSVQTHFINIYAFSIITTAYVIDFSLHYHIKLTQNLPKYLSIHYKETKKFLNVQRSNKWHKCNSNFFPVFFYVYDNFIEINNSLSLTVIYQPCRTVFMYCYTSPAYENIYIHNYASHHNLY